MEQGIRQLCQACALHKWLEPESNRLIWCVALIFLGGGLYGFTLGVWRSPLQGVFVAVKFPMLLLLTALGTALANSILAQLLGARMTLRQSTLAVLMSFALLAALLASLTPLILFFLWHLPVMGSVDQAGAHRLFLLMNVVIIAFSGTVANLQLYRLLHQICTDVALKIIFIWLGMNLFLGAQLSWNLRPFFGTPGLPVHFLREDPFAGSFYEAVFKLLIRSLQ